MYALAERQMGERFDVPLTQIPVPDDPAGLAEGERLATVRGCFWCHGASLEGQKYFAEAGRGLIVIAPNLTRIVREQSPAEFARTVRHGVRPDGTSLQPAMPSFAFYNMSDADIGAIIAYISSLPEQKGLDGRFDLLPIGWFRRVLDDQLPPSVATLIDHEAPRPDKFAADDQIGLGRYLTESICTECHGDNGRLRVPKSPDLIVASAYSYDDFVRLMRTGAPVGDRKIDYHMVDASKYRYTRLFDEEVDALYVYFRSLAGVASSAGP
jgi:mono/diheme cytochrome c family protein